MTLVDIIVADDHTLFRSGLVNLLQGFKLFNKIHEADDGTEVLRIMKERYPKPKLVLLDVKMPKLNGLETVKILKKDYPDIKIIMLTMVDQEQFIAHMLKEDVNGYLLKNSTELELKTAIEKVIKKGYYFNEHLIRIMHKSQTNKYASNRPLVIFNISDREKEIIEMLCKEYSAKEIADDLNISKRTVEVHKQNLMEKTGTKNAVGLVLFAINNGIVKLNLN